MTETKTKGPNARALAEFRKKFAKDFGEDRLIRAVDRAPYEVISTGSLALDYALGCGGYVEGRLVEVWGVDSIGKTTLCLMGIGEAQRKHPDKLVGFIDMEQTFDKGLAAGMGVDLELLDLYTPNSAEDVADAMKRMLQSGFYSMIVLDSIGSMIPEAEKEKDADEAVVALQAKIVTRMVKIAAVEAARTDAVVLMINQVRANVGGYGADTTTSGGFALKHVTTHKLKMKRTGTPAYTIQRDGEKVVVGHEVSIEVERNKVAPPRRVAVLNLFNQPSERFGPRGIDRAKEAFVLGSRRDVGAITRAGAWYTLPDGERCQGEEKVLDALRDKPELITQIREIAVAAMERYVIPGVEVEIPDDDESGEEPATPNFKRGTGDA